MIIPGIILSIMFSLVVPAIMIEDIGALDSLSRSRKLVSYRWLKTFALLLIVYSAVIFASFIGNLVGRPLWPFSTLVGSIVAAFLQPIIPISLTVCYYAMVAKEAESSASPTATAVLGNRKRKITAFLGATLMVYPDMYRLAVSV